MKRATAPLSLAPADRHRLGRRAQLLAAVSDVVMPQYLGSLSEIGRFEAVAVDTGAAFV